jgi:hypothetical protein
MNYMEEKNYCKFNVSKNQYYIQSKRKKKLASLNVIGLMVFFLFALELIIHGLIKN